MPNDALVKELRDKITKVLLKRLALSDWHADRIAHEIQTALEAHPPSAAVDECDHCEADREFVRGVRCGICGETSIQPYDPNVTLSPVVGAGVTALGDVQITPEEIASFHSDGSDLIFQAQQIVDKLGEPRHGFEAISIDTILVAMMLTGAVGLRQALSTTPPEPQGRDDILSKIADAVGEGLRAMEQGRKHAAEDHLLIALEQCRALRRVPATVGLMAYIEAEVTQHWKWGNLTRLGVANMLKRMGFNMETAIERVNEICGPVPATVGEGEMREILAVEHEKRGQHFIAKLLREGRDSQEDRAALAAMAELQRRIAGTQKVGP